MPPDFEVITDALDPFSEAPLKDPPTKIMNLITGPFPRPHLDRVPSAEWVARFEIAWH
jgi:hypothetical protein